MTIRRRLALSFLCILLLFAINLLIYFWGGSKREATVVELQDAISRQNLIASISQNLNDVQKEVNLLMPMAEQAGAATPETLAEFRRRLDSIAKSIAEVRQLTRPQTRVMVELFAKDYGELAEAWGIFLENFGRNQAKALTALSLRGEPLAQRVMRELLPQLQEHEKQEVKAAGENFYRVARLTDQIAVLIFAVSTVLAIVLAYRISRYLVRGLNALKVGAAAIGAGDLSSRVTVISRDELGELAQAYNEMADRLDSARKELTQANQTLASQNEEILQQRQVAESLLLNILPVQVAAELKAKGKVEPKYFEEATILFTDFVGFTLSTEKLAAEDLVLVLHDYFTAFDRVVERYKLEKLKTIGDSYMCVGGLPLGRRGRRVPSHPVDVVMAAFEMLRAAAELDRPDSLAHWSVRVGIHTGPVVAGVVGIQKFAFDVWGDSVNLASRMESAGVPGLINVSERTYSRVKDFFECEHRGKILTKEKKELDMYFVNGLLPRLLDGSTQVPPPAFLRRYRAYFQKEPPSFPAFLLSPASAGKAIVMG